MKLISVLVLLGVATSAWGAGCTISPKVKDGSATVVFSFKPTPQELLATLGASPDNKSPEAILNLLQSFTDQATDVFNSTVSMAKKIPIIGPLLPTPTCRYYWISNQLFCDKVPYAILQPICMLYGSITNVTLPVDIPLPIPANPAANLSCEADNGSRPWGLDKIQAPDAWNLGFKGQGIVVANIDTGVRGTHNELRDNLRPTYNWYDPYKISATPTDGHGHGTHAMGSICGKTVGVAPDAKWIACRGCNGPTASCGNEQLLQCGQWMSCPDNRAHPTPCSTRPHIINNSWGGGQGDTAYFGVLATWKALGIASFFSAGNSGANGIPCGTVVSPADANYTVHGHLSVGSSQCDDAVSSFSSKGPSMAADYLTGLGVQLVGPGTHVRSSWPTADDAYNTISGTSMSSPHAAGGAAVVLSQRNNLTPAQLYSVLMNSADRPATVTSSTSYCGSSNANDLTAPWPNNAYGFGRVNVFKACNTAL